MVSHDLFLIIVSALSGGFQCLSRWFQAKSKYQSGDKQQGLKRKGQADAEGHLEGQPPRPSNGNMRTATMAERLSNAEWDLRCFCYQRHLILL